MTFWSNQPGHPGMDIGIRVGHCCSLPCTALGTWRSRDPQRDMWPPRRGVLRPPATVRLGAGRGQLGMEGAVVDVGSGAKDSAGLWDAAGGCGHRCSCGWWHWGGPMQVGSCS